MNEEIFKRRLEGKLVTALEPGFGAAADALIWNGRKPPVRARYIVHAASVADVQEAVRFAAANGLSVSPRGGGHHFTGIATQADVVIDLAALDHLRIDVAGRRCEAGPAVTNERLNAALARHRLGFPVGHCGSVPISGYLLGGGVGWNAGSWGIACFLVESADVVMADGRLLRVSETEHPDIFWALRGAGPGFFGIVTSYRLKVQQAACTVLSTVRVYPAARAAEVAAWAEAAIARAPANVEFTLKVTTEASPFGPMIGIPAVATVFAHTEAEAKAILAEIGRDAPEGPVALMPDMPTPIAALYEMTGAGTPKGKRYAVDSLWSDAGLAELLDGMVRAITAAPSEMSFAILSPSSPQAAVPGDAAFSKIGRVFGAIYTVWDAAKEDAPQIGWLRASMDRMQPLKAGIYVGYGDIDLPARRAEVHSAAVATRLAALREQHDPEGRFGAALRPAATLAAE